MRTCSTDDNLLMPLYMTISFLFLFLLPPSFLDTFHIFLITVGEICYSSLNLKPLGISSLLLVGIYLYHSRRKAVYLHSSSWCVHIFGSWNIWEVLLQIGLHWLLGIWWRFFWEPSIFDCNNGFVHWDIVSSLFLPVLVESLLIYFESVNFSW